MYADIHRQLLAWNKKKYLALCYMYETINVNFEISNFQLLTYQLSSTYGIVFSLRSISFLWTYKMSACQTDCSVFNSSWHQVLLWMLIVLLKVITKDQHSTALQYVRSFAWRNTRVFVWKGCELKQFKHRKAEEKSRQNKLSDGWQQCFNSHF